MADIGKALETDRRGISMPKGQLGPSFSRSLRGKSRPGFQSLWVKLKAKTISYIGKRHATDA